MEKNEEDSIETGTAMLYKGAQCVLCMVHGTCIVRPCRICYDLLQDVHEAVEGVEPAWRQD